MFGSWGEERMPFEAALVNDELEDPLFHAVAPGQQEPDWQELAKEYWGAPDQPDIYGEKTIRHTSVRRIICRPLCSI